MSIFDDLPEPASIVKSEPASLVPKGDRLRDIEAEIQEEAAEVIQGALSFADINPTDTEPPHEWVKALGMERAWKRFKLAQFALLTPKEAPIGLRMAKDVMMGYARVRSKEKIGPKTLNMVVVQMTGTLPTFPEREVDK